MIGGPPRINDARTLMPQLTREASRVIAAFLMALGVRSADEGHSVCRIQLRRRLHFDGRGIALGVL
jgi:hypothetical protein